MRLLSVSLLLWTVSFVESIVIREYQREAWYGIDDASDCKKDDCLSKPTFNRDELLDCLKRITSTTCKVDLMGRGDYITDMTTMKPPIIVDISKLVHVEGIELPFNLEGVVIKNFTQITNSCGRMSFQKAIKKADDQYDLENSLLQFVEMDFKVESGYTVLKRSINVGNQAVPVDAFGYTAESHVLEAQCSLTSPIPPIVRVTTTIKDYLP